MLLKKFFVCWVDLERKFFYFIHEKRKQAIRHASSTRLVHLSFHHFSPLTSWWGSPPRVRPAARPWTEACWWSRTYSTAALRQSSTWGRNAAVTRDTSALSLQTIPQTDWTLISGLTASNTEYVKLNDNSIPGIFQLCYVLGHFLRLS